MPTFSNTGQKPRLKLALMVVVAAAVVAAAVWFSLRPPKEVAAGATFKARRGNLTIRILEGGSVEALEAQEIRSQIRGYQGTKILRIVDEGYMVTDEDVKNGKVLVELDSSDLRDRIITQDIQYQSTLAALIDAQQAFDIQLNQNLSDIKAAQQKARFARMDLEKYLGALVASEVIGRQRLYEDTNEITLPDIEKFLAEASANPDHHEGLESESTNGVDQVATPNGAASANGTNGPGAAPRPLATQADLALLRSLETNRPPPVDFSQYAKAELLGDGSAKQQLRKLMDDLQMAKAQQSLAKTKLEGTRRLYEKKFVTKTELDTEQLNYDNNELKIKTAETALDLFIKYEFPKQAEEAVSKYDEALRGLTQVRRAAVAKLAQARARLKSAEGRFKIESEQRRELYDQLEKCVIRAERTGLVVYGTDGQSFGGEQIREGATVRERQKILTIPDMKQMAVKVKIHEAFIKQVCKGQPATIKVDAYPDERLTGEVDKVGILPDYQNRWMNPDIKVYITTIAIHQVRDWLKPGMSAKVEILVKQLTNVVYVPLQSVSLVNGKHTCFVKNGGQPEPRVVEIGEFNDEFIEIKSGLKEGEVVLLRAPEGTQTEELPEERIEEPLTNLTEEVRAPELEDRPPERPNTRQRERSPAPLNAREPKNGGKRKY